MALPATKLSPEEVVKAIDLLTPGEKESLAILCDKRLTQELRESWLEAKTEYKEGKTVSLTEAEAFKDLD